MTSVTIALMTLVATVRRTCMPHTLRHIVSVRSVDGEDGSLPVAPRCSQPSSQGKNALLPQVRNCILDSSQVSQPRGVYP
jgi:hypothetical protein